MMTGLIAAGVLGNSGGTFWVLLALGWLLAGLLMWIGARMAGLRYVTVRRAVFAAIAASLVTWICLELFSNVLVAGISVGVLLGLVLSWFTIKEVLNTSMSRALLVWVFDVFAHLVAGVLGLTAGGFRLDLQHLFR
jgi:hypothetical protein